MMNGEALSLIFAEGISIRGVIIWPSERFTLSVSQYRRLTRLGFELTTREKPIKSDLD
jgi:hypothetical protein